VLSRRRLWLAVVAAALLVVGLFFALRRGKNFDGSVQLRVLSDGFAPLHEHFDRDQGFPKMLLLLSPSSETDLQTADAISTQVLPNLKSRNLHVYVVWVAAQRGDTIDAAMNAAKHFPDPRVAQYWDADLKLGMAMGTLLALPASKQELGERAQGIAWGIDALYPAGSAWSEASVPRPSFWMHQRPDIIAAPKFNAETFRVRVDAL
jgi:hypothetical protein